MIKFSIWKIIGSNNGEFGFFGSNIFHTKKNLFWIKTDKIFFLNDVLRIINITF